MAATPLRYPWTAVAQYEILIAINSANGRYFACNCEDDTRLRYTTRLILFCYENGTDPRLNFWKTERGIIESLDLKRRMAHL